MGSSFAALERAWQIVHTCLQENARRDLYNQLNPLFGEAMQAILALEDGRIFRGEGYGHPGECQGEVVFNTSLTGYQEIATDPSYAGQIVVLTNPQIGNYG